MDDMVLAAMVKWPNVPACCGWLGLDTRGDWYMRDAAAQAAGPFQAACHAPLVGPAKGSRLQHLGLSAFIGRNYAVDETGRWYFQNGPQRVFVELASTPWVWCLDTEGRVHAHTGVAVERVLECVLDEVGRLYLLTNLGFGLVHSLDVQQAAVAVEAGIWQPVDVVAAELPTRYGYVVSPAASPP